MVLQFQRPGPRIAFSLIELLAVLAIIGILAALLLPALSAARMKGQQVACVNHLKQLAISGQMYAADNEGKLAENFPASQSSNNWVLGDLRQPTDCTNEMLLRLGKLFPYASQVSLYRCPADPSRMGGMPRLRSYSMNGWVGNRSMETQSRPNGLRTFVRESELAAARPARLWVTMDEHERTIDDPWFLVTMDDSKPFASAPATRHGLGYGLNFADGHVEAYKLRDPESRRLGSENVQINPHNSDWLRLKEVTTSR
jgi:prepilin-type N-terminal cleavage/methylation domain-containing protein/prepilin-type processing-associated H-X9-DG protein